MEKHFTASALIFHNDKVCLLLHKKLGVWLNPGGHVEGDENPDEALRREVKEETGLNIVILGDKDELLGNDQAEVLHVPYCVLCERIAEGHYHNDLIYLCESNGGEENIAAGPGESENIGFYTQAETLALPMFPNTRALLTKAFRDIRAMKSSSVESIA